VHQLEIKVLDIVDAWCNHEGTHFCYRLSRPQGYTIAGMIKSMQPEPNLPLKFLSII